MQFNALFSLFESQNSVVMQQIDHLLAVFQTALASTSVGFHPAEGSQLKQDTRDRLVQLVTALNQSAPDKVAAAGERLGLPVNPNVASEIVSFMQVCPRTSPDP